MLGLKTFGNSGTLAWATVAGIFGVAATAGCQLERVDDGIVSLRPAATAKAPACISRAAHHHRTPLLNRGFPRVQHLHPFWHLKRKDLVGYPPVGAVIPKDVRSAIAIGLALLNLQ